MGDAIAKTEEEAGDGAGDCIAYSIPEGAALISVSVRTLQRYIHDGKLKVTRLGSRVLVPKSSLESFIADGGLPGCNTRSRAWADWRRKYYET